MSLHAHSPLPSSGRSISAAANEVPLLEVDEDTLANNDIKARALRGNLVSKSSLLNDGNACMRHTSSTVPVRNKELRTNGFTSTQHSGFNSRPPTASGFSSSRSPTGSAPLNTASLAIGSSAEAPPTRKSPPTRSLNLKALGSSPPSLELSEGEYTIDVSSASPLFRHVPTQPKPKKVVGAPKLLSVIEEETIVMLPTGFLRSSDGFDDPYSMLSILWASRGGEDVSGTYITWINPDREDSWDAVKPPISRVPDAVPPRGTPEPSSDESEEYATPQPATLVSRRETRATRRKIDSLAYDVDADTRYFGVSYKKGKLVRQGVRTVEAMGPLDKARFRDYRLLPVDYFVSPMEGLKGGEVKALKERKGNYLTDGSPDGGARRRRRKPREHTAASKPREDPPKKASKSRVGKKYQATIPSRPMSQPYRPDMSYVPESDQLWDPKKAEQAMEAGEDIDGFLDNAVDLNSRMLLMESLHRAGYSVDTAVGEFVTMWRRCKEPTSQLHLDEIIKSLSMFETSRKEFHKIAKEVGRSTSSVLVQYYQWKGRDTDGVYSRLKREWKAEGDTCDVCDDGGILLVCDLCHKAYHLECLQPPLKQMPKASEWYCSHCMKSPAKLRRIPSMSLGSSPYTGPKPHAMRALNLPSALQFNNGKGEVVSYSRAPDDSPFQAIPRKAATSVQSYFVDLTST